MPLVRKSVLALLALVCSLGGPVRAQQSTDALGRPMHPQARAKLQALETSLPQRRLSAAERDLLLALFNSPELDAGVFKERGALVRHFIERGVALSAQPGSDLQQTDIWRLVSAARAASEAFQIPPAILLCLSFRESSFNPRASAWTTSAKGVGQLTNGAVVETISRIHSDPQLKNQTDVYARLLGATLPDRVVGAADVDGATSELQRLEKSGAPDSLLAQKRRERKAAIASHKDEPGHIYNIETNFGLSAAYLAYLRRRRLPEIIDEEKAWLTAVGAYNQGMGPINDLIYGVFQGARDYNAQPLDAILSAHALGRLKLLPERQRELADEVGSVRRCAGR